GKYKYIHYSSGEDELYNIETDFHETTNLSGRSGYQGVRNRMFRELSADVGYLRPPMPLYECLYYGEFSQELNGWRPSEPNGSYGLSEGTDALPTRHLVLNGNATNEISSLNVSFRQSGPHTLEFEAYSEEEPGLLHIYLAGSEIPILDTVVSIGTNTGKFMLPVTAEEPLPAFGDLKLSLLATSPGDVHMDNVFLRNDELFVESAFPCYSSEMIQTDVPFTQLEINQFEVIYDQPSVECENIIGTAPQLWQQFTPTGKSGIIVSNIFGFDPVIEIYTECGDSDSLLSCTNNNSDLRESIYLSSLTPGETYYVRITSEKNLPPFNEQVAAIQNLFINAKPTRIAGENIQFKTIEDSFELENQSAFDYSIDNVSFLFKDHFSGEEYLFDLPFDNQLTYPMDAFEGLPVGSAYRVSVAYSLNSIDIEVPYGKVRGIVFHDESFTPQSFSAFPNPFASEQNRIQLNFASEIRGEGVVSIYDMTGRMILETEVMVNSEDTYVEINGSLSVGSYLIVFEKDDQKYKPELFVVR
ncbi:MAG: T9SS type A sorting domain-containing protein, partial [Cryomorphaceae bacterium]